MEGREEETKRGMYLMRWREQVTKKCSRVCIRVARLALPESGERKRNLTTTGLGENKRQSETRPVPTKPSQSPLRIRSVQVEGVKELVSDKVTSHEGPIAIQGEAQPGNGQPL